MKKYRFHTCATMKPHNSNRWWIDRGIVSDMLISADNVKEALSAYRERVEEQYISISDNAMKRKQAMYRDGVDGSARQVGYVLTAKTGFESRSDNIPYREEYIELWVEISEQVDVDFCA